MDEIAVTAERQSGVTEEVAPSVAALNEVSVVFARALGEQATAVQHIVRTSEMMAERTKLVEAQLETQRAQSEAVRESSTVTKRVAEQNLVEVDQLGSLSTQLLSESEALESSNRDVQDG